VRLDVQSRNGDPYAQRDGQRPGGQQPDAKVKVWPWWAPIAGAAAAVGLAVAVRIPFWGVPLTTDEGGYGEVARLWARSRTLYDGAWVDRPQGLILIFRAVHFVFGGSAEAMRAAAAIAAVLAVAATMLLTLRLARGRITACAAGLLMATAGASPFIEGFTLSGELLASVPALLSLLAFTGYLRDRRLRWLVLAGLLTGCAVMIRQAAFDAGLAAALLLLITERRRGLRPAGILIGTAFIPALIGALSAASFSDWWFAVVGYRLQNDSLVSGASFMGRVHVFSFSLPYALAGLALLALLAGFGWRRAPLLARLWIGTALLAVVAGGNFHNHYYLQLVAPLSIVGALGLRRIVLTPSRGPRLATALVTAATVALTVPLWFMSGHAQAQKLWPKDHHLVRDAAVAQYVRTHTRPHQRILVMWASASLYYLADREPALRWMWLRNLQTIEGAALVAERVLANRPPALVIRMQPASALDGTDKALAVLRRDYRLVARIDGVPIYRPKKTSQTSIPITTNSKTAAR
jgi:4-amino-4-deoxy-L-arabinose transferase-like glycosyltransferase